MKTVLGCIGCGNMGGAILRGLSGREDMALVGLDHNPARVEACGAQPAASLTALAAEADVVLVAVKPDKVGEVLQAIAPVLTPDKVVVSIASGVSQEALRTASGGKCPVVRVMPNTPAMVGAGVFALCFEDPALDDARKGLVSGIFNTLGRTLVLPEAKFMAFTAVVGCGPAYVFHFMEAVIEASVTLGFTRKDSTDMVTDLFAGSVKLAQQSETHLSVLREQVCSPGGNTIAAMNHLDRTATRGHIIDAILAAYRSGLK